jgi:hypothetical protein
MLQVIAPGLIAILEIGIKINFIKSRLVLNEVQPNTNLHLIN